MRLQFIPVPSRKYVLWIWLAGDLAVLWLLNNHEVGAASVCARSRVEG